MSDYNNPHSDSVRILLAILLITVFVGFGIDIHRMIQLNKTTNFVKSSISPNSTIILDEKLNSTMTLCLKKAKTLMTVLGVESFFTIVTFIAGVVGCVKMNRFSLLVFSLFFLINYFIWNVYYLKEDFVLNKDYLNATFFNNTFKLTQNVFKNSINASLNELKTISG